ncbi:hypothetical protein [Actinomadura rudentiformis]|uniref:hypothetical protein n=1 Tax=Actinomadura rudentiformis TaxID=359158 RepID=UPI00178C77E6|nr:hypothetical protein [Actinomadura rudentiformis]
MHDYISDMGRVAVVVGAGYGGPAGPDEPRTPSFERNSELTRNSQSHPIHVDIYLDTDDERTIRQVVNEFDRLVDFLGFDGPFDPSEERGSFIRRSWARMKLTMNPAELGNRSLRVERALEAHTLVTDQAKTDAQAAAVIAGLIQALSDVPNACLRAGSIVMVKYETNGASVMHSRQLSQVEMRAWERFPEIHREPSRIFEALAVAVAKLDNQQFSGH